MVRRLMIMMQNLFTSKMEKDASNSNVKVMSHDVSQSHPTAAVGQIGWNEVDGTLDLRLKNDVTLQLGQEIHIYGKAQGAIANGDVIQYVSAQGDHIVFKKAVGTEVAARPALVIGVATQNITNGEYGYVTFFGKINNIHTNGFAAGDVIYFDTATSTLTNIPPVAPKHKISIGAIIKQDTGGAANGILAVKLFNGLSLYLLDDVYVSSPADGHVLVYNFNLMRWENKILDSLEVAHGDSDVGTAIDDLENKFLVTDSVTSALYRISFAVANGVLTVEKTEIP